MKHLSLFFIAACAADVSELDNLKDTKPKAAAAPLQKLEQPTSHADDARLLSEEREALTEPLGALVEPKAIATALPQGRGTWTLGAELRSDARPITDLTRFVRRCNDVTGCTLWRAELVTMKFELTLKFDADGTAWLIERDEKKRILTEAKLDGSKTPVTLISHLGDDDTADTLRFVAEVREGALTLETLAVARELEDEREESAWGVRYVYDFKTQADRPETQPVPEATHARSCTEAPATQTQLVDWFAQGAVKAPFKIAENFGWTRTCHALSGCTEWVVDEKAQVLKELAVKDATIVAITGDGAELLLTDSAYTQETFTLTVGATCARAVGLRSQEGPDANKLERFDSGVAFRGSGGPSDD